MGSKKKEIEAPPPPEPMERPEANPSLLLALDSLRAQQAQVEQTQQSLLAQQQQLQQRQEQQQASLLGELEQQRRAVEAANTANAPLVQEMIDRQREQTQLSKASANAAVSRRSDQARRTSGLMGILRQQNQASQTQY